ncbi:CobW family GTP-binding protein [Pseudomonas syringae]|uniref:Cobalamin synthesis protein CobW n=1 Tax=Pseudomonas syringae pv. aceris TaxID=199198 RepID=A0A0L8IQ16_PSESX|nr:GTP-binding protein [Pseudomonas syringae]EGH71516.1 cobalamin synthesis protein CobW [Pseudomonas syringae pv. aceris str. M302273]KOG03513.1 Cobalamin synthesis protein CobW [Pseudomonas syringae pv. aceris]KPW09189.1 Cobalamin synthesis protein CobW [Pseudomonas syringae pv. aceris]
MNDIKRLPVIVLTGYLGAGKTTLLNYILKEQTATRFAVVVNEFGEVGIDNDIIVDADEEVFEMNNGCICCTVRGDLIRILGALMRRRDRIDCILIETTGLADPAPVAQTFFVDDDIKRSLALDSIIAVVDAGNFAQQIQDSHEAVEQVAFADLIVLNKSDVVTPEQLQSTMALIRSINPTVNIEPAVRGRVAVEQLLDRGQFDLSRILELEPEFLGDVSHEHDSEIVSLSLTAEQPIDQGKFSSWIGDLLQREGQNILRSKGILDFGAQHAARFAFQAVHMAADGEFVRPWAIDEVRVSKMVFIGRHLDQSAIRAGFAATWQ